MILNYDSKNGFNWIQGLKKLAGIIPSVSSETEVFFGGFSKNTPFTEMFNSEQFGNLTDDTFRSWAEGLDGMQKQAMDATSALKEYKKHLTSIGKTKGVFGSSEAAASQGTAAGHTYAQKAQAASDENPVEMSGNTAAAAKEGAEDGKVYAEAYASTIPVEITTSKKKTEGYDPSKKKNRKQARYNRRVKKGKTIPNSEATNVSLYDANFFEDGIIKDFDHAVDYIEGKDIGININPTGAVTNIGFIEDAIYSTSYAGNEAGKNISKSMTNDIKKSVPVITGSLKQIGQNTKQVFSTIGKTAGSIFKNLGGMVASFGANMLVSLAVGKLIEWGSEFVYKMTHAAEVAQEKAAESKAAYEEESAELESLNNELKTTSDRIDELNAKSNLSLTEKDELAKLQEQNDYLEKQIELQRTLVELKQSDAISKALKSVSKKSETVLSTPDEVNDGQGLYKDVDRFDAVDYYIDKINSYEDHIRKLKLDQQVDGISEREAKKIQKEIDRYQKDIDSDKGKMSSIMDELSTEMDVLIDDAGNAVNKDAEEVVSKYNALLDDVLALNKGYGALVESKINGLFATKEFDGLESQLNRAAKQGQDVLLDMIPDNLSDKLASSLEISRDEAKDLLKEYFMELNNPEELNTDEIKNQLKRDFTAGFDKHFATRLFRNDQWITFTKDKSDEDLEKFYRYLKENNLDPSVWTDVKDWELHFKIAVDTEDATEKIVTFQDLLKEGTEKEADPANIAEHVEKYSSELSNLASIQGQIKSGEFNLLESFDAIKDVPELIGHTGSLEEFQNAVNNLSYDKLREFANGYKEYISELTNPKQIELAKEYLQSFVRGYSENFENISKQDALKNMGLDGVAIADVFGITSDFNKIWSEFGDTEKGREIIATLSLNPDAASWTYEQWITNIENEEVYVDLRIRDESIEDANREIQRIQDERVKTQNKHELKQARGEDLTFDDYQDLINHNQDEMFQVGIKISEVKAKLDTDGLSEEVRSALESELAGYEAERTGFIIDNINLRNNQNNIPKLLLDRALTEIENEKSLVEQRNSLKEADGYALTSADYRELIGFNEGAIVNRQELIKIKEEELKKAKGAAKKAEIQEELTDLYAQVLTYSAENIDYQEAIDKIPETKRLNKIELLKQKASNMDSADYSGLTGNAEDQIGIYEELISMKEDELAGLDFFTQTEEWLEASNAISQYKEEIEALIQSKIEWNEQPFELAINDAKNAKEAGNLSRSVKEARGYDLTKSDYDNMIAENNAIIQANNDLIDQKRLDIDTAVDIDDSELKALEEEIRQLENENIELEVENIDAAELREDLGKSRLEQALSDRQSVSDRIESNLNYRSSNGERLTADDYAELFDAYNNERETTEILLNKAQKEFEEADPIKDLDGWYEAKQAVDNYTQSLIDMDRSQLEYEQELAKSPILEIQDRRAKLEQEKAAAENEMALNEAKGIDATESDYRSLISQTDDIINELKLENEEYSEMLENSDLELTIGDKLEIESIMAENEAAINSAEIAIEEYGQAIKDLPVNKLATDLELLQSNASALENVLSMKEAAGLKATESDYYKLIENSVAQVKNLEATNAELLKQQSEFKESDSAYKNLQLQIEGNELAIQEAALAQKEWNDAIKNLPIVNIQELSSAISTALSETNESAGLSVETMDTIRKQFSDIEDMDVEDIFYSTADGVKISTKKLAQFAKAENKIVRAKFDREIADQEQAIKDYQKTIRAGMIDDHMRELQGNLEGVMDRQAAYFAEYQKQMESISKYAQIEIAENTPNQGSKYDAMQNRLESWKEMYDKGLWGTDDFQSMGEYFNAYGFGDSESFMDDYKRASRYITEDASGVRTFFDDLEKKGLATYQTLEDGSETLVLDFKDAADAALTMGMGEEFFLDMFGKAEEYGASAVLIDSLTDSALQTNELNQELYEAQKRLIELKAAGADASAIEKQEGIVAGIKDELKTVEEVTDNYIANQDEKFTQGFMGLKDLYSEYQKYYIEAMGKGDTATAEKWLDDMQNLLDEYGFEIDLSAEGIDPRRFKIDDIWQNQFEKMTVGKMGSWENQLDPDTLGVSAENIEAFKDVRSTLSKAYKENKDGLRENLEILKKYDAETLKSIDLADGAYGEYADAEKALDALAKTLGITDPQKLQMMAYALEGVGNVAPKLQPIVDSLEEMRETGDIQITTEIDADLSLLTLEELEKRSEELEGLKIQFENDPEMLETINILQTQTDIERGVRFVQEDGYSIEELVGLSDQEVMEIAAQIGIDESELRSAIDQIESQEIGMTVKIAESQFQQLTNPNPINAEAANAEIDSIKENIATLPETAEENVADVNVNTISAVKDINGVDKLLDKLDSTTAKPRVDVLGVDTAISRINSLVMQLNKLANKQITVRTSVNSTGSNANHSGEITAAPAADGTLYGAYADGTAYNMLNLRAYAGGTNVGLKHDETALVNEEGTEGLIRDGILYEIPGGMHTQALKKGDIILSVQQMQQLKETGKASGHGKRYGSAYADGTLHGMSAYTAGNIKIPNSLTISPKYEGSLEQAADNLGKALNSSTGTTKKSLDDIIDALNNVKDWIEVLCNRLQEDIDYKLAQSDNAVSYGDKNSLVSNAQTTTQALIEANTAGAAEYGAYANKVAKDVGLSKKLKKKVQNGTIEIEKLSEDDQKRVQAYEEWYQKQRDCLQAAEELKASLRELAQQKFDNIATEFDNMLGVIEHTGNLLNISMEKQELKGHITSAKYYQALINNTKDSQVKLVEKQKELETSLKESMDAGIIKEGSVEWYEMQGEINGVIEEIKEADNQILQFQNDIRETKWAMQDMAHENINRLTSESDFLIDLMSSDKLFDDKGNITSQGMATSGLNMMNYNTALSEAQKYKDEYDDLQKQIADLAAKGDYDLKLNEQSDRVHDAWMNMCSAAKQYEQAIKDLKDQEFQAQLESLQKLSDKYMEVLNKQKDMYDYQNEVSDQTAEISRLEKLQMAYANDTSEEGRLKRQQVENDLEEARKNLEETQYDKYISDQQEILDSVYTKTEEFFQQRLDNVDQLLEEATFNANANKDQIRDTLKAEGDAVAYDLTTEMESIWGTDGSVLTTFKDDFANKSASTLTILGTIRDGVAKMAQISDNTAQQEISGAGGNTDPNYNPNNGGTANNLQQTSQGNNVVADDGEVKDDKILKIIKSGKKGKKYIEEQRGKKNHSELWKYIVDTYGRVPTYEIYRKLGKELGVKPKKDYKDAKDTNALLKALKAKGYRKGTDYLDKDRWTMTQEDGREIIALPDGSILAPLGRGSGVINNAKTEQILSLANNHDAIMDMMNTTNKLNQAKQAEQIQECVKAICGLTEQMNHSMTSGVATYNGTTININLPGVQKPEDFMNWLRNNTRAQHDLQDVVFSEVMGRGKLSTRKK